jgi:ATPase subunit of ABC transporter with duplicated ATPase domains
MMFMLFRLRQPNFLILDEPTNHIDLDGREQLEQQLLESGATLLITSHDRRFIEQVAERWWWISKGILQELHDPGQFYTRVLADQPVAGSGQQAQTVHTSRAGQPHSEEQVLERIDELETLLAQDKARKPKFQKPALQQQWQSELNTLWAQLE